MEDSAVVYLFGPFQLEPRERRLLRNGTPVALTPKVLDLLCLLVRYQGSVLAKDRIMAEIWADTIVEDANLVQSISVLRRALGGSGGEYIETVSRVGYRFVPEVEVAAAVAHVHEPHPAPVETRYTLSGDVNLAYQVVGGGPIDIVFVMGWVSHLEYFWTEPSFARFLRKLASFSRVILFDKRGTGLSDRVPHTEMPTLEQRMDDLRAVMDAAGSKRAVILGVSEGGPMSALFAATYPERTASLVMIGTYAKRLRDATYPWGPTPEERAAYLRQIREQWGGPVGIEERAPSRAADPAFREWWATYLRMGASPGAALALTQMNAEIDVRAVLPSIRVPSLVIHRTGDQCLKVEEGRYVASLIPGAHFSELPGDDHLPFVGDQDAILDEIRAFLDEVRQEQVPERVLCTVMCFGVARGGAELNSGIQREIQWFRGQPIETRVAASAIFDGPARAIRCAASIVGLARRHGAPGRAGLHTGECDRVGENAFSGTAVEIASKVLDQAARDEVLVSSTVRDLVAGSGILFRPAADRVVLSGDEEWRLYQVQADRP